MDQFFIACVPKVSNFPTGNGIPNLVFPRKVLNFQSLMVAVRHFTILGYRNGSPFLPYFNLP